MMESTGYLSEQTRANAAEVLARRLSASDIRTVLSDIEGSKKRHKSVEWIVAETTGRSARLRTRIPDDDLALFLVDLCGVQLLENRALRERLALRASDGELDKLHDYQAVNRSRGGHAARARAVAMRRWEAGKSWPRHFVQVLDLPRVFAGLAGPPSEPDSLTVFPFVPLPDLEDFQQELTTQVLDVLTAPPGANRGVLTLPTGAGKTRTAVEALVTWRLERPGPSTILWIAQSEELCEQAAQAFREVWIDLGHRKSGVRHSLDIARLWGSHSVPSNPPDVVVASIQKLQRIVQNEDDDGGQEDLQALRGQLGVTVVDEAHRALAPSYTQVLTFLDISLRRKSSRTPLLGLTATPFRANPDETRQLVGRFHGNLIEPRSLGDDPIRELRQRDVLSQPMHELLDYDGPEFPMEDKFVEYFETFEEFHPAFLQRMGEARQRNEAILERLLAFPRDCPTLFFGCSVEQARAMSVLLRRAGRSSETVTGTTRGATRRALIEEFREGRLSVLCNYGVLTTGFDAPRVQALVVARPTTSRVLYEQMIGRGMRGPRFGGTRTCKVVDVVDNIRFSEKLAYRDYSRYWRNR